MNRETAKYQKVGVLDWAPSFTLLTRTFSKDELTRWGKERASLRRLPSTQLFNQKLTRGHWQGQTPFRD